MKTPSYKISVSEGNNGEQLEIVLEGDLSLRNASEILKSIRSLKSGCSTVLLKVQNVAKLDITTLQTIRVFRNKLSAEGKNISVKADLTDETESLLRNSGFNTL
jgi:ABC-type transporter Mla MlaB component